MSELRAERDEIKRQRDAISNELEKMKGKVDSALEAGVSWSRLALSLPPSRIQRFTYLQTWSNEKH